MIPCTCTLLAGTAWKESPADRTDFHQDAMSLGQNWPYHNTKTGRLDS